MKEYPNVKKLLDNLDRRPDSVWQSDGGGVLSAHAAFEIRALLAERDKFHACWTEAAATNRHLLDEMSKAVGHARAVEADRDAWKAKAKAEARPEAPGRRLREYKGVTYRGGSWHYRDTSAFMASALISGYCDTFTDADHAAIYALRDDPYEPVETVNDILVDFARDLSTGRVVFHDTFVTRIRAAVAAEKAQGEGR